MIEVECIKTKHIERWFIKGTDILHRDDGPAVTEYYDNGNKRYEEWYQNGKTHREDGPSEIDYFSDGTISYKEWYQNGKLHRVDGPAQIWYYTNGNKNSEQWFQHDNWHRVDGPAVIYYKPNGYMFDWNYYINGEDITDWVKENFNDPLKLTPEEKALMLLNFG